MAHMCPQQCKAGRLANPVCQEGFLGIGYIRSGSLIPFDCPAMRCVRENYCAHGKLHYATLQVSGAPSHHLATYHEQQLHAACGTCHMVDIV